MTLTNEIHKCEVCNSTEVHPVLDLGKHPLCDDLVPVRNERACIEYPIEILYCSKCATAHQQYQVPKQELFPTSYHYRSRFTADVLTGMSVLVDACEKRLGTLKNKFALDIGCNDASLLDFFQKKGAKTVGIEPTNAYRDGLDKGHKLINAFFSPDTATRIRDRYGCPDVITFTNVFAHIENLPEVIDALKILMSTNTMLVIENHYLGAVLNRYQFDTFYHEHPRTYSLTSFRHIADSLGINLSGVEFPARYGGNIRVFMGGPSVDTNTDVLKVLESEKHFGERLQKMQEGIENWKTTMTDKIKKIVAEHGKIHCKAFPGRAAILVKLLNLDENTVEAVYEKPGSMKIGHYLPGTRIPILSDDSLFSLALPPPVIINLAWHISPEICDYLKSHGYKGNVIDILDPVDFSE